MSRLIAMGAVVAQVTGGTWTWMFAQAGGADPANPSFVVPLAVQLGVGGIFLWLYLRLLGQQTAERAAHNAELKLERDAAALTLANERQANRDALAAERTAHVAALRAERDAHMAEIARERAEVKQLYDRVVDKVVPTLEATIHMANEVRDDLKARGYEGGGFDQGHGRRPRGN